jgi:peptide/nickel transport system substrate-binding protein
MDPGLSYRLESWQLFQDVYIGLVVKAHVSCQTGNCAEIKPGLATTIGDVTNGGKDYKFTLRKGMKYSNGEPIKASDFKYSIIRLFKLNSPGIGFYSSGSTRARRARRSAPTSRGSPRMTARARSASS